MRNLGNVLVIRGYWALWAIKGGGAQVGPGSSQAIEACGVELPKAVPPHGVPPQKFLDNPWWEWGYAIVIVGYGYVAFLCVCFFEIACFKCMSSK